MKSWTKGKRDKFMFAMNVCRVERNCNVKTDRRK